MKRILKHSARLGSAAALVLLASTSIALAQTATQPKSPTSTGCSSGAGTDMTQCQNNISHQQLDGSVGNGQVPNGGATENSTGSGGAQNTTNGINGSGGAQNTASPGTKTDGSGGAANSNNGGASSN